MRSGIGGLTAAHELAKRGYSVTIYERHAIVGGLARSTYVQEGGFDYPTEYSWRVYGTHYKNILRLLKEIPLKDGKRVFDNLVNIKTYLFPRTSGPAFVLPRPKGSEPLITNFTLKDKLQILNKILYCVTMSQERMNTMDGVRWTDFCSDLSEESRKYVVRIWGPVLGMDPTYMSFPVVARMMKVLLGGYTGSASGLYVMNKPTNDAWFHPWINALEATGRVNVKTKQEIVDVQIDGDRVTAITLRDSETGEETVDSADEFVFALPVESVAALVKKNRQLLARPDFEKTVALADVARQVQLSVLVYFNQRFVYPTKEKNVLYLPDTPWALIIEPEALIWEKTYSTDERVKSVLSVGICQTDVPGVLHKKAFTACTPEEVREEVLHQIAESYHTSITMEDGSTVGREHLVHFSLWESFTYNEQTKRMDTWEPKFSNNAGSFEKQPSTTTSLSNVFFATGYTKTDRFIYSMESAVEAGVRCANAIFKKTGLSDQEHVFGFNASPLPFRPLAFLDALLFRLRLPHASKLFFGSSIALCAVSLAIVIVLLLIILF